MQETKSMFRPVMIGNQNFPRYGVVDNRRQDDTYYWTGMPGHLWSRNVDNAMLWDDCVVMFNAMQSIMLMEYPERATKTYTMTVEVTVLEDDDKEVSLKKLQAYLGRTLQMQMDYNNQGMGPKGSIVFINADIKGLQEAVPAEPKTTEVSFSHRLVPSLN